ncbi:hypothetical protein UlMin_041372 [Ulmus minor]
MLSHTSSSPYLFVSPSTFSRLNSQPIPFFLRVSSRPRIRIRNFLGASLLGCSSLGFFNSKKASLRFWCSGGARRCKDLDSEGDIELEAEILEFMKTSEKPEVFPSKKELVDAGRMDLVDAISKRGGWLSLGWDLDEESVRENGVGDSGLFSAIEFDNFQKRNAWAGDEVQDFPVVSTRPYDGYSHSSTSSGRSLEKKETGIEGIINRLENQRNSSFGFGLEEKEETTFFSSKINKEDSHSKLFTDGTVADIEGLRNLNKPDSWRVWSIQRAAQKEMDLGDSEIASHETRLDGSTDISKDETVMRESTGKPDESNVLGSCHEDFNPKQVIRRLQHMKLELSSVLDSLMFHADEVVSQKKDHESSSDDLQKLSDAWEFQQNEIMNARDKLRSIRAKIAILEGKMAVAIIDAQKIVEQKQKKIDEAHRALRLLRSTCIVWPNAASEVLLTGSFDGWISQRKMERSSKGVFSLCLQLYPGKYEIKFIVDGKWQVDPLRPIVKNNGYENNLLVIS